MYFVWCKKIAWSSHNLVFSSCPLFPIPPFIDSGKFFLPFGLWDWLLLVDPRHMLPFYEITWSFKEIGWTKKPSPSSLPLARDFQDPPRPNWSFRLHSPELVLWEVSWHSFFGIFPDSLYLLFVVSCWMLILTPTIHPFGWRVFHPLPFPWSLKPFTDSAAS